MNLEKEVKKLQEINAWILAIPKRIAHIGYKNGLNQSEFCAKYGINLYTFSRLKKGNHKPTAETINKIESAFKNEGV